MLPPVNANDPEVTDAAFTVTPGGFVTDVPQTLTVMVVPWQFVVGVVLVVG